MLFDEPTFLVQIGHNGHKLTEDLLKNGDTDGGILSPADYEKEKNKTISNYINKEGGYVLFDPQFYIPRTERPNFDTYDYYIEFGGDDFDTAGVGARYEELCRELVELQDYFNVDAFVSPARFLDTFSDSKIGEWMELSETFLAVAEDHERDIPTLISLPIYQKSLIDTDQRNNLLNKATQIDADGFYVSAEFDSEVRYPLRGPANVYALLDLLNRLRKNRYEVVVGHTHQIAHLFMGIGVNAFASGHYNNLRSFDTRRWDPQDEQGGGRIVIKYYTDKLLNELRVDPDLDLMYQKGDFDVETVRQRSPYDGDLFDDSIPPSTTGWKFRDAAWDHYCWACHQIAERYRGESEERRIELAQEKITEAKELYDEVSEKFGMLNEPEAGIYSDWETAFALIKEEVE